MLLGNDAGELEKSDSDEAQMSLQLLCGKSEALCSAGAGLPLAPTLSQSTHVVTTSACKLRRSASPIQMSLCWQAR